MKQELVAGIILGVIGLSLVAVPSARWWALTERWKTKDGSQPSKGYAVLMRVLGAVFALVGGMLIKWAVK